MQTVTRRPERVGAPAAAEVATDGQIQFALGSDRVALREGPELVVQIRYIPKRQQRLGSQVRRLVPRQ